jgi:hypothetical protein
MQAARRGKRDDMAWLQYGSSPSRLASQIRWRAFRACRMHSRRQKRTFSTQSTVHKHPGRQPRCRQRQESPACNRACTRGSAWLRILGDCQVSRAKRPVLPAGAALSDDTEEVTGSNPIRPTYCDLVFLVPGSARVALAWRSLALQLALSRGRAHGTVSTACHVTASAAWPTATGSRSGAGGAGISILYPGLCRRYVLSAVQEWLAAQPAGDIAGLADGVRGGVGVVQAG